MNEPENPLEKEDDTEELSEDEIEVRSCSGKSLEKRGETVIEQKILKRINLR